MGGTCKGGGVKTEGESGLSDGLGLRKADQDDGEKAEEEG